MIQRPQELSPGAALFLGWGSVPALLVLATLILTAARSIGTSWTFITGARVLSARVVRGLIARGRNIALRAGGILCARNRDSEAKDQKSGGEHCQFRLH